MNEMCNINKKKKRQKVFYYSRFDCCKQKNEFKNI